VAMVVVVVVIVVVLAIVVVVQLKQICMHSSVACRYDRLGRNSEIRFATAA